MAAEITSAQGKLLSLYLSTRKVLVADPNKSSRTGIAKTLISMGAKTNQIFLTDNYSESLSKVKEADPSLIISEYTFPDGSGLELAQESRTQTESAQKIFIMVTGNSSQSVVAEAAEGDVDMFIIKPYSIKSFTEIVCKSVLAKVYPSDYMQTIEAGRKLLLESKPDEAITLFNQAVLLNPKPSLALFYRGQAQLLKKLLETAEDSYSEGLKFNDIHYRCITGLFDLLMSQKRLVDAYTVVKKIARVFPANPKRLSQVLTLAVQTGNMDDIENYYETFKSIETRNDELIRYICAAMVVCGIHFFRLSQNDKAIELLKKSSISAAGRPQVLREIVSTFINYGHLVEAKETLSRFPADTHEGIHYQVADFLLYNAEETDSKKILNKMRQEWKDTPGDPIFNYWAIFHLRKLGKMDEAENAYLQACKKWPEKKNLFKEAVDEKPGV